MWWTIYGGILILVGLCCWAPRDKHRNTAVLLDLSEYKAKRR